jgi:hypothetical protein
MNDHPLEQGISSSEHFTPEDAPADPEIDGSIVSQQQDPWQGNDLSLAWIVLTDAVEARSQFLLPLLGYGLLAFTAIEYIYVLIPPRFTDPQWELETLGQMINVVWAPVMGATLVFFRSSGAIRIRELRLLSWISRCCLGLGLVLLLSIPLSINNGLSIYDRLNTQASLQLQQRLEQLKTIENLVKQASTNSELETIALQFGFSNFVAKTSDIQTFQKSLLSEIKASFRDSHKQFSSTSGKITLLRNVVKLILESLLAGVLLIKLWHLTDWARLFQKGR